MGIKKTFRGLTLSRRRPLSNRNQSIDLQSKSMDWFLYDNSLRHERVKLNKVKQYILQNDNHEIPRDEVITTNE